MHGHMNIKFIIFSKRNQPSTQTHLSCLDIVEIGLCIHNPLVISMLSSDGHF